MEKKTKKENDWDERWFEVFKAAIAGAVAAAPIDKTASNPKFIVQKACGVASHAISVLREIEENKSKQE